MSEHSTDYLAFNTYPHTSVKGLFNKLSIIRNLIPPYYCRHFQYLKSSGPPHPTSPGSNHFIPICGYHNINKMTQTRQSGPLLRSKSTENSQIKRRTVKRSEAGTEQLVEDTAITPGGTEENATGPIVGFWLTFIFPLIGYVVYFINRKSPTNTARYIWAYRAMRLSAALMVVYSFIICSVLHQYSLAARPGDIAGYSYQ